MSDKSAAGPAGPAGPSVRQVPEGDTHERLVCPDCGFIDYQNPKIVVGSVVAWEDRILLCRRAIEPRTGYWTLPAGYLELNESTQEGARREAREEANAEIAIDTLMAIYNIPRISQVHLFFRARLVSPDISPGIESLEVELFRWDDIPRPEIAFPSVHWALDHFQEIGDAAEFAVRGNPDGETGDFA